MTARGGTPPDTIIHTLTFSRSHTPFGCAAVSTWPMTGPLLTGHSHEGRVWGWTGYSTTSRHGRTELRWEVPGPFITLVVWGPGASLLPSLCLCLHQINGLGTTEEVFQSALPAKIVHHSDSLLFIMALIQGHTLSHAQMFIAFYSCWFEVKFRVLVAVSSGYKLLKQMFLLAITSPTGGWSSLLDFLSFQDDISVEFWMILFGWNGWNTIG